MMADNTIIYLDDWNIVFRKIPKSINDNTYEVFSGDNYYVDLDKYATLKSKLALLTKDIGDFDFINHATGDQAVTTAITLCRKYLGIQNLYIAEQAYNSLVRTLYLLWYSYRGRTRFHNNKESPYG